MQTLIEGQDGASRQLVMQSAALFRVRCTTLGPASPAQAVRLQAETPASVGPASPWAWAGMLFGAEVTAALGLAAVVWIPFAGQ